MTPVGSGSGAPVKCSAGNIPNLYLYLYCGFYSGRKSILVTLHALSLIEISIQARIFQYQKADLPEALRVDFSHFGLGDQRAFYGLLVF